MAALPSIQSLHQAGCGTTVLAVLVDRSDVLTGDLLSSIIDVKCYFVWQNDLRGPAPVAEYGSSRMEER